MIYSLPSTTFESTCEADTGLTGTIGIRVTDNAGATVITHTTAGITEYPAGSGIYQKTLTAPAVQGQFTIVWDDGTVAPGHVSTEELVVTENLPVVIVSTSGADYTTAAALKATTSLSGTTYADADIQAAITGASRAIDEICQRRFWLDDTATIRYFTPDDRFVLEIDDLSYITELATDTSFDGTFASTWAENTDYTFSPLNAAADGRPFTRIEAVRRSALMFQPGMQRTVRVTGKFGWPAVPQQIVEATSILATQLVKRKREAPFGAYAMGQDGYAVRIARSDAHICMLIDPYRKHRTAVA